MPYMDMSYRSQYIATVLPACTLVSNSTWLKTEVMGTVAEN